MGGPIAVCAVVWSEHTMSERELAEVAKIKAETRVVAR